MESENITVCEEYKHIISKTYDFDTTKEIILSTYSFEEMDIRNIISDNVEIIETIKARKEEEKAKKKNSSQGATVMGWFG